MLTRALPLYRIIPMYRMWAIGGGALLTCVCTFIRIPLPFTPVPITLQTFSVLLVGALLGRNWGGLSQALYLTLGAIGLPVFSVGLSSGFMTLAGPTGGYLLGFALAALLVGYLFRSQREYSWWAITWRMALGTAVIFATGLLQLGMLTQQPLSRLLVLGFWPFVPGAIAKLFLAVSIFRMTYKPVRNLLAD